MSDGGAVRYDVSSSAPRTRREFYRAVRGFLFVEVGMLGVVGGGKTGGGFDI